VRLPTPGISSSSAKIGRPAIGSCRQRAVQAADEDIARSHVVAHGHHDMRQLQLPHRLRGQCCNLIRDAIRAERRE
jgi:hypothetical protein